MIKRFRHDRNGGFTLIELLIVIAIILILIAIALPNFLEAQIRARLTSTKACLNTYKTANAAYFTDFQIHAPDVDGGERSIDPPYSWESLWQINRGINCDNVGELCTYAMLTTPIPYITTLCFDPFIAQQNAPEAGSKEYSLPEYGTNRSGDITRLEWGNRFGLYYIMLSRGPDLDSDPVSWDGIWSDLGPRNHYVTQTPTFYSPTNGTKSNGDLIVTNRGHEI